MNIRYYLLIMVMIIFFPVTIVVGWYIGKCLNAVEQLNQY